MPRGSKPGERRGGRKPGVPNKLSGSAKAALAEAFHLLGDVPALVAWAKDSPGQFYLIWSKLLPHEVSGPNGGPIRAAVNWHDTFAASSTHVG